AAPAEAFLGISADLMNQTVEANFSRALAGGRYDIVHFQHLAGWSSLMLPLIAKAQGARVVLSLHDYFLLCPDYNLVDPSMHRCGKTHADYTDPRCLSCLGGKRYRHAGGEAPLLHRYLIERRALIERVFDEVDAIISPSCFVRDLFARSFGESVAAKIRVFAHGTPRVTPSKRPKATGALRVGFLGNLTDRKGGEIVIQAARRLQGKPVRISVFGGVMPALQKDARKAGLRLHGAYNPAALGTLLEQVDLVLIPSIWDETFCLTLMEAQALGVPVLATAVGAIQERVDEGETGFLFPPGDPDAMAERLLELQRHRDRLDHVARTLRARRYKSIEANVAYYADLYTELLADRTQSARFVRALLGQPLATAA
ncbi:MAG: glycosyltransferase, partial [Myxococcales bacterium]|nr:glycosyltransferase [Myxococcales bacterium]